MLRGVAGRGGFDPRPPGRMVPGTGVFGAARRSVREPRVHVRGFLRQLTFTLERSALGRRGLRDAPYCAEGRHDVDWDSGEA